MINRIVQASRHFAGATASPSSPLAVFARDTASGLMTTGRHAFMILGVSAIGALALMFVRPDVADRMKALSPFVLAGASESSASTAPVSNLVIMIPASENAPAAGALSDTPAPASGTARDGAAADKSSPAVQRQQMLVTNWLAKKYRVASDATDMLVSAAYVNAREIKLDPLLILSVMAIESGFNPFAESPVGAQGLMQVMSKVHEEKFQPLGGVKAALNPVANIKVGSLILKDYVTRGGSVEAGLKLYVGAAAFDSDFGYGSKVLAEYRRLKDVATGKHVPVIAPALVAKTKPVERAVAAPAAAPMAIEPPNAGEPPADVPEKVAAL